MTRTIESVKNAAAFGFLCVIIGLLAVGFFWVIGFVTLETAREIDKAAHPTRTAPAGMVAPIISTRYDLDVVAEVVTECERLEIAPAVCLGTISQEGGLVRAGWPRLIGDLDLDSRGSCGPLQIYIKVHGRTCDYWFDVGRSFAQMGPRWKWAWKELGGGPAFAADPVGFLQRFAPLAQGSIAWSRELTYPNLTLALKAYAQHLDGGSSRCAVADALRKLAMDQQMVAGWADESAWLANAGTLQSGGHPVGTAYADQAARAVRVRDAQRGLAEASMHEATLLCGAG